MKIDILNATEDDYTIKRQLDDTANDRQHTRSRFLANHH